MKDLNQVILDIAGGFETLKRLESEMREELLKEQQEQQHQASQDDYLFDNGDIKEELNFND